MDAQLCFTQAVIFIHKYINQLKMKPDPSISLRNTFPMKFIVYNFYPFITSFCCYHLFTNTNDICNDNQMGDNFFTVDPYTREK